MVSSNDHDGAKSAVQLISLCIEPDTAQKEILSSWALFILIMLLIIALFASYMLQHKKIQAVHETVLSIFAGRASSWSMDVSWVDRYRYARWTAHQIDGRNLHSKHRQL